MKVVQQQKGVELGNLGIAKGALQVDAGTLDGGPTLEQFVDAPRVHVRFRSGGRFPLDDVNRADRIAGSAVDANLLVDLVSTVLLADGHNRANFGAGATIDTAVDNVMGSHGQFLSVKREPGDTPATNVGLRPREVT
jgi:hypothetical protein